MSGSGRRCCDCNTIAIATALTSRKATWRSDVAKRRGGTYECDGTHVGIGDAKVGEGEEGTVHRKATLAALEKDLTQAGDTVFDLGLGDAGRFLGGEVFECLCVCVLVCFVLCVCVWGGNWVYMGVG